MVDHDALLKELLETFALEAQDHIGALLNLLLSLEREADAAERTRLIEGIFRRMHTLKGAAHAVNLADVAQLCQELEDLLADLKRGDIPLEVGLFDRLHSDMDTLSGLIGSARPSGAGPAPAGPAHQDAPSPAPVQEPPLPAAAPRGEPLPPPAQPPGPKSPPRLAQAQTAAPAAKGAPDETVRVSTRLLESLLLQSEELVSAKLAASALSEEIADAAQELRARGSERARALEISRRVLRDAASTPHCAALAAFVESGCQVERLAEGRLLALGKSAEKHLWTLQGMIDPLLKEMKHLHLVPFSSLVDPFSKLVRDLARQLEKEAELHCLGGELEIDRRILAELKEPLLHLVRNVIDHGIETPAERRRQGKPAKGNLRIEARLQDANRAELLVCDDGCGIDLAKVKGAALGSELATPEVLERMSDAEAMQLIFESGISTSRAVTSISGRGVGLAIVREALERLGGHVSVESECGRGTLFRLVFPLSFAMMRGVLVQVAGRDCIIPADAVEMTTRLPQAEIRRVENRETVLLGGEVVSLVRLARVLELEGPAESDPEALQPLLLLHAAGRRIAFAVDQVAGVQEILVKPLGRQLSRVRNVAGATVLGNGRTVPILNVADLFRSALLNQAGVRGTAAAGSAPRRGKLSVLVAEDSITSRTLLKNILESCGFRVRTAIDGLDALTQLKAEQVDIVVSDVEMPRMDGFELTAAIRGDSRFASLPVILVTGRESREDRERGIDAGASAYLVKSSFDQSSLIEVIRKFA